MLWSGNLFSGVQRMWKIQKQVGIPIKSGKTPLMMI